MHAHAGRRGALRSLPDTRMNRGTRTAPPPIPPPAAISSVTAAAAAVATSPMSSGRSRLCCAGRGDADALFCCCGRNPCSRAPHDAALASSRCDSTWPSPGSRPSVLLLLLLLLLPLRADPGRCGAGAAAAAATARSTSIIRHEAPPRRDILVACCYRRIRWIPARRQRSVHCTDSFMFHVLTSRCSEHPDILTSGYSRAGGTQSMDVRSGWRWL
jgi:hypothetical protein